MRYLGGKKSTRGYFTWCLRGNNKVYVVLEVDTAKKHPTEKNYAAWKSQFREHLENETIYNAEAEIEDIPIVPLRNEYVLFCRLQDDEETSDDDDED